MSDSKSRISRIVARVRAEGPVSAVSYVARRAGRKLKQGSLPSHIHVEVSNTCNLSCEYCVLRENARGDKVMSGATFDAVLPFLRDASSVSLSGLAEPLMNTRLASMVRRVREIAPDAWIAIDTNATLLDREVARALVEAGLSELVFSLDGTEASVVEAIRSGGSLEEIVTNIRGLRAVMAELGSQQPQLTVTVVLQRRTLEQLPSVIRLAEELGVSAINVNGLEPYVESVADQPVWTDPGASPGLDDVLRESAALADSAGIELRFASLTPSAAPVCPQIATPIVLADGTVVPCSVLAYDREVLVGVDEDGNVGPHAAHTGQHAFGNVRATGLKDIWEGREYREFRARVASGDFPSACSDCLMKFGVICPSPARSAEELLEQLKTSRAGR